jgi:hypothetical protein
VIRVRLSKVREDKARRWGARLGFTLRCSRAKRPHMNNYGFYQLANDNDPA